MENCLITRLKDSAENGSLPKIGRLTIKALYNPYAYDNTQRIGLSVSDGQSVVISTTGNGYFSNTYEGLSDPSQRLTQATVTGTTKTYYYFSAQGGYEINIDNKYELEYLSIGNTTTAIATTSFEFNIEELEYCTKMKSIIMLCPGSKITGNISYLSKLTELTGLAIIGNSQNITPISGDIASISNLTSLAPNAGGGTSDNQIILYATNVTGSIEDFVAGQVAAGRTQSPTGTVNGIRVRGWQKQFTFGGTTSDVGAVSSYNRLIWDGTSKIILRMGSSYTSMDGDVFAKGASDNEISEWENQGLTVHIVE